MFAVAVALTVAWMALGVVAVVALVRGRVGWARIHTRKAAGWVLVAAVAVMIISGLVAPEQQTGQVRVATTSSSGAATPVTATTSPLPAPTPAAVPATPSTTLATAAVTGTMASPLPVTPVPQAVAPAPDPQTVQAPAPPPRAPAAPVPASPQWVTPGAFCAPTGAIGTSKTGKTMVCDPTATDDRNRWRHE